MLINFILYLCTILLFQNGSFNTRATLGTSAMSYIYIKRDTNANELYMLSVHSEMVHSTRATLCWSLVITKSQSRAAMHF